MYFDTVFYMFPFLFVGCSWKQVLFIQAIPPCSTSDQLNLQDTAAENEEQYTLSNIIYIHFQNCYFFYEIFFDAGVPKR